LFLRREGSSCWKKRNSIFHTIISENTYFRENRCLSRFYDTHGGGHPNELERISAYADKMNFGLNSKYYANTGMTRNTSRGVMFDV